MKRRVMSLALLAFVAAAAAAFGGIDWYRVSFNDKGVSLDVAPPGKPAWKKSIPWASVVRVCFKPEYPASDGIYVFVKERPESYAIPVESAGGGELWDELVRRDLFSAKLAIKAASATEGVFCWPEKGK